MKKKIMNMGNARVSAQKKKMKELQKHGICPFCSRYFKKYHDAPVIKENAHWLLTKNDYPYEGAVYHLLLIHKKHIENMDKITPKAATEMSSLASWAVRKFKIKGGCLSMRFGDFHYNAATVAHLHAHIITGSKEGKNKDRLTVQVGFKSRG